MASGSFRIQFKIQTDQNSPEKTNLKFKIGPNWPGRENSRPRHPGRLGSRPGATQVDWAVDLGHPCRLPSRHGVDWGVDLAPEPGRTQPTLAGQVCVWSIF